MQAEIKRYSKEQLLQAFAKKSLETIKELMTSLSEKELLSVAPFECANNIKEQVQLDLNDGFYEQKQKPFRVQNDGGNFKRGFNDNNQQKFNKQRFGQPQGSGGHSFQNHTNNGLKDRIPVFVECGFETDSSVKVWYYKLNENIEGPFNSPDMDEMLFTGQVSFDTRVVFKEKDGKFVSIKKLITHTFGDKYNTVLEAPIQPKQIHQYQDGAKRGNNYKRNNELADNSGIITRSSNVPLERTISDNSKEAQAKKDAVEQKKEIKDQSKATKETQQPTTSETTHQITEQKQISTNEDKTHLNQKKQPETSQTSQNQDKEQKKQTTKETTSEQKKAPQTKDTIKQATTVQPVTVPLPQSVQISQPQDLEGFQTVSGKSGMKNKKFNKKNATKIVVVGLTEQEVLAEENRKRLEEIRLHDQLLAQKYAAQQREFEKENPQKKIDIFDEEEKAQAILSAVDSFPTLGGSAKPAATQQAKDTNKDVNPASVQQVSHVNKKDGHQEGWIVNDKNKKKNILKRSESSDSDEEYQKNTTTSIYNRDLEQKQWEQEQQLLAQEERKRIEEFQQKQFAQNMGRSYREQEEQPVLDSADKDSFPSLGGSVYTGPPKNIVKPQTNKNKGKNSKNAPSVPFSYPKTQENAWDIPSTGKQVPSQKQQQQTQPVNSNAHTSKGNFANDFPSL